MSTWLSDLLRSYGLLALLPSFLEPEWLIERGGLALIALIVFAESGLLVGFFLPGDSLLFIAGLLASPTGGNKLPHVALVVPVIVAAAIAGDQVGYLFGQRVGPALFDRPKSRFFNPGNVAKASHFLDKHGPKAIVLARFVPIVRTFAPIVAGIGTMNYRTFVTYNVVGGVVWGAGVTLAGYFLGEIDAVRENVELALIAIVAVSVLPMVVEVVRHWRSSQDEAESEVGAL
jgi:membrane-associated protein